MRIIFLLFFAALTFAQNFDPTAECPYGIYTKHDVPGSDSETTITVKLDGNPEAAFIFYLYFDSSFLGIPSADKSSTLYFCDQAAASLGDPRCTVDKLGTFIYPDDIALDVVAPGVQRPSGNFGAYPPRGQNGTGSVDFTFVPTKAGLYCYMSNLDIYDVISVSPTYGKLDGFSYPLLPFYGALTLAYLAAAIAWGILSAMYWRDILPIQNYIGALYVALTLDNAFRYGYYSYANNYGTSSSGLLAVTAIINSLRNALTFFVLLIVSLGYGVVKPSLGPDMKKCLILAGCLFFSFLLFSIGVDLKSSGNSNISQLLFILPVSFSMTIAFYWTIGALSETVEHLTLRRQNFKLGMFTWLKRILIACLVIFAIGIFVSGSLTTMSAKLSWFAGNWYSVWFYRTGWLNVLFFFSFVGISLLWRPTQNNARYGLEELSEFDNPADNINNYDIEMNETLNAFEDAKNNSSTAQGGSSAGRYSTPGKERAVTQVFNIGSDDDE